MNWITGRLIGKDEERDENQSAHYAADDNSARVAVLDCANLARHLIISQFEGLGTYDLLA